MVDKQLLITPFDPATIRQRPGSGRSVFDYVAGGDVIRRVIDSSENEFGWSVDHMELMNDDGKAFWVARGTLTIAGLGSRDGLGTHPAEGVDAAKAAETDAFKRAAVKFGVALHLYSEDPSPNGRDRDPGVDPEYVEAPVARRSGNGAAAQRPTGPAQRGLCPDCHAPGGSPHTSRCRLARR